MALKYTNAFKFDDPNPKVDVATHKVPSAFLSQAMRRALQGINNRVIGQTGFVGAAGTFGTVGAGLSAGSNAGTIQTANKTCYLIDGKPYTLAATNNMVIPLGLPDQGTASWCYYLVSAGTDGTGVQVSKGNDGTSLAAAMIGDLPDQNAALGYFLVQTISTKVFQAGVSTMGETGSFTITYADLFGIPIVWGTEPQ